MESVSIVIPCFNSKGRLKLIASEIIKICSLIDFEIIFVNDGSSDSTWNEIENLSESDSRIKGISLSENMGQQNAVFAGLMYSSGDYVITMDDDMQHDPEIIPVLIAEIRKNYDIVYAVNRKKYSFFRKAGSFAHDIFFYTAFRKPLKLKITSFRIMKKSLVDKILKTDKKFIYISAIALSFKPEASYINTDTVTVSESRYSIGKLIFLFSRLVFYYGFPRFIYRLSELLFSNKKSAGDIIEKSIDKNCGRFLHE